MVAALRTRLTGLALMLLLGAPVLAVAQGDPTRPPPGLLEAPDTAGATAIATAATPPPPTPPPLVQAIRTGPGLEPSALLDGRLVHVGDRVRDNTKVIAITAHGILLRRLGTNPGVRSSESWVRIGPDVKKSPASTESKK